MHIAESIVRGIARFGYAARGLVYLVVGGLAMEAALELEEAEDIRGAMRAIVEQQFGVPVLLGIAAGLLAYSVWRVVQSLLDVDGHGYDLRGLSVRVSLLISAGLHVVLAWASLQVALHIGSGEGTPTRDLVTRIFSWPMGSWLVAGGGLLVLIAGLAHIYKGATAGFRRWFKASDAAMRWIDLVSRFGLIARGLLFLLVGGFAIYAGLTLEAGQVRGLRGVLLWIQQLGFGRSLLGLAGCGLFAFGVYSVIEAFVRRVGVANT